MNQPPAARRVLPAVLLLSAIAVIGTVGYRWIEGWSLAESLYMTVTTVTTVGFAEVRPLSQAGRVFPILLLVLSLASVGYAATVATWTSWSRVGN